MKCKLDRKLTCEVWWEQEGIQETEEKLKSPITIRWSINEYTEFELSAGGIGYYRNEGK